jgi:predicted nuclease of restriction endonuclease-like (RecB) superfamily
MVAICQTRLANCHREREYIMNKALDKAIARIQSLIEEAKKSISASVNQAMLNTYWGIGQIIVEVEQDGQIRADYGSRLLVELSKELTRQLGRGYSRSNLQNMRNFYLTYPICQMASGKLSWSHYVELVGVKDENARSFYEQEAERSAWSVDELKRQIGTSLFERLLLSDGKANKEKVLSLATQGINMDEPSAILKQPYVFEFLGIKENKPIMEKELEARLIRQIEDFLLELGRGFMFVGSQQRMLIGGVFYRVDMVFYNKYLKAYVLIDLKSGELSLDVNFSKIPTKIQ